MSREAQLARQISDILAKGLVLTDQTVQFMASTFGDASQKALASILTDTESCERDLLLELIFFPDEPFQLLLEEQLAGDGGLDAGQVVQHLVRMLEWVPVRLPDQSGSVQVELDRASIIHLVDRLRITVRPDRDLVRAVQQYVKPGKVALVLVKIRNVDLPAAPHIIRFLCRFFQTMDAGDPEFMDQVDFILQFAGSNEGVVDIFKALMDHKNRLYRAIEQALAYEKQLTRYNVEVMILKGARNPCISVEAVRRTIRRIDRICMTLFGRCSYPQEGMCRVDLGVCDAGDRLKEMVRLFSE